MPMQNIHNQWVKHYIDYLSQRNGEKYSWQVSSMGHVTLHSRVTQLPAITSHNIKTPQPPPSTMSTRGPGCDNTMPGCDDTMPGCDNTKGRLGGGENARTTRVGMGCHAHPHKQFISFLLLLLYTYQHHPSPPQLFPYPPCNTPPHRSL